MPDIFDTLTSNTATLDIFDELSPSKEGQSSDYRSKIREPYQSELDFFRTRPEVAGMATEDKRIILNPFNNFNEKQKDYVYPILYVVIYLGLVAVWWVLYRN